MEMGSMLVLLPGLFVMNQLDFTNPTNVFILRVAFGAVQGLLLIICGVIFLKIRSKNQQAKVKVPAPSLPSWAPAPDEPQLPTELTTAEYDSGELRKLVGQTLLSVAICSLIHYKWDIVPPLFMQTLLAPFNMYKSNLFKIHILNQPDDVFPRPFAEPPSPFAKLFGASQEEDTNTNDNTKPETETKSKAKTKAKTKKAKAE